MLLLTPSRLLGWAVWAGRFGWNSIWLNELNYRPIRGAAAGSSAAAVRVNNCPQRILASARAHALCARTHST